VTFASPECMWSGSVEFREQSFLAGRSEGTSEAKVSQDARQQAFERVKKRRDFSPHLLVYVRVDSFVSSSGR